MKFKKNKNIKNAGNVEIGNKIFNTSVDMNAAPISESIEKHEELNPKIWDKNEELLPEVREGIEKIVNQFVQELKDNEVDLKILDTILVGSNASYNYTKDSDLDVHIVADTSFIPCEYGLLPIIYNMARSQFNNKYDITIHGVPIELYVEDMTTSANSNGIYSLKNGWVKKPEKRDIPKIDISDVYPEWEERANALLNDDSTKIEDVDKFIDDIYLLRKTSIMSEGEYGKGNMVFKEIRNNGYLDKLKDLKIKLTEKDMIVEACTLDETTSSNFKDLDSFLRVYPVYYNDYFVDFVDNYLDDYDIEELESLRPEDILDSWFEEMDNSSDVKEEAKDYNYKEYLRLKIKEKMDYLKENE